MKVVKEGVTVTPGLALGSWVAFKKMGNEAMVMGDLVLTEEEIEPVMLKLQQQGIDQTSIHNHLLGESPRVIYMHIEGHGDPVALARSLASAIALTKTPPPATGATPAAAQQAIDLKTKEVEQALGYSGKVNGGILQFSVSRVEKITDSGMEVPYQSLQRIVLGLYGYQQGIHCVSNALGGDTDSLLIERGAITGFPPRQIFDRRSSRERF
jgi:hypothetical protein